MAVVMMDDDKDPIFHDFLGMSSGTEGEMESSDLGSEKQAVENSTVFHFHGRKNAISEAEASNVFSGRKRSSSSSYMGLVRDRMLSVGSDALENSCLMKAFGKEVASERLGQLHDDEMPSLMQPPPRPTSSLSLHPPVNARPHSLNPGSIGLFSSRFGQSGAQREKLSSSYTYKDVNVGAALVPQAAADEGSRTGKKGSGILKIINSSCSGAGERIKSGALPYGSRTKTLQIVEPGPSNIPRYLNLPRGCAQWTQKVTDVIQNFGITDSQQKLGPSSRQMTIFYGGQAHVFDDVHPNKADVIMALAGSSGGSWSTDYSKLGLGPPVSAAKAPSRERGLPNNNLPLSIPGLIAQTAQNPLTDDPRTLTPGGGAARDSTSIAHGAESDPTGK